MNPTICDDLPGSLPESQFACGYVVVACVVHIEKHVPTLRLILGFSLVPYRFTVVEKGQHHSSGRFDCVVVFVVLGSHSSDVISFVYDDVGLLVDG